MSVLLANGAIISAVTGALLICASSFYIVQSMGHPVTKLTASQVVLSHIGVASAYLGLGMRITDGRADFPVILIFATALLGAAAGYLYRRALGLTNVSSRHE